MTEEKVQELLSIIIPAVKDYNEIVKLRQEYSSLRVLPTGGECSAYRALLQEQTSQLLQSFTEQRLGFMLHDLSELLIEEGLLD